MSALLTLLGRDSAHLAAQVQNEYEREVEQLRLAAFTLPVRPLDVVHVAPWIFADVSAGVSDNARVDIAVSALLYRDYLLAFDAPVDGEVIPDPLLLLTAGQWHERALTRLLGVVPAASEFWPTLASLARRQIAAAVDERALRTRMNKGTAYSFETYAALAAAKSAVLVAIPAACSAASGQESMITHWETVLDPFSIGAQLRDDITDWRSDWIRGNVTYTHLCALERGGLLDAFGTGTHIDVDQIGHHLFHDGVASELMMESLDAFDASIESAGACGAQGWARFAQQVRSLAEKQAARLSESKRRTQTTISQTGQHESIRRSLEQLLRALDVEHARGYPEASHRMQYARYGSEEFVRPGDSTPNNVHEGAVFHRAIIGWFHALADDAGLHVPTHVIEENLDALIALRVPGEVLWSYHPTIAALPPDIDDLAQVLLAFLGNKSQRDLDALFDRPVQIALDTQEANGAIETWVIDPSLSEGWKNWYRRQIAEYWGPGAEPEVVANLAAALFAWKPQHFAAQIARATRYVCAEQARDGSWASTWYVGPYYGTFVGTRLLNAQRAVVPEAVVGLKRARDFLLTSQRTDGGWGVDDRSDPMSTAFALLGLADAADTDDLPVRTAIERAVWWLILAQRGDGLWTAMADFISFDLHRQAPEFGAQMRYFRSTTVASAYAGAALIAARQFSGRA